MSDLELNDLFVMQSCDRSRNQARQKCASCKPIHFKVMYDGPWGHGPWVSEYNPADYVHVGVSKPLSEYEKIVMRRRIHDFMSSGAY